MTDHPKITPRQGQVLAFIHACTARRGVSPSFEEIGQHLGTTPPSVNGMIKTLEKKGLISRVPGKARTLRVEVPASMLPATDFGKAPRIRGWTPGQPVPALSSDAAAAAIFAILDRLHPLLREAGVDDAAAVHWLASTTPHVRKALVRAGCSPDQAEEVASLVGAQAARWWPESQGVSIRRRQWTPR